MAKGTLSCEEIGACEICAHCIEQRHPWYFCGCGNDAYWNGSNYECDDCRWCGLPKNN